MVEVLCIVQARLTSERLSNKVLLPLGDSGISLLEHVFYRLQKVQKIDKLVFAIPDTPSNLQLAMFLDDKNIPYCVGSENDVLDRFWKTAIQEHPKLIVRATCDNPLVDWELVDALIDKLEDSDWISCDETPLGKAVDVFTMNALSEAYRQTTDKALRAHVTPYIWQKMKSKKIYWNDFQYRLTVDEPKDFELMNSIYNALYRGEPIPNSLVYGYLQENPKIARMNQSIHQKIIVNEKNGIFITDYQHFDEAK